MAVRKSTKIWLALAAAGALLLAIDGESDRLGPLGVLAFVVFNLAVAVLLYRGAVALWRVVVRRLALRLAFSYFLIGIVPIPLLLLLVCGAGYLLANQYVANRLRREVTAVGEHARYTVPGLPSVSAGEDGRVRASAVSWLPPGAAAPWLGELTRPGFLVHGSEIWLAVPGGDPRSAVLLRLDDPAAPWLQDLADRTGYPVRLHHGSANTRGSNFTLDFPGDGEEPGREESPEVRPRNHPPAGDSLWRREWIEAFYIETVANATGEKAETGENVAVITARTSPEILSDQLFSQGVAEIGKIFLVVLGGLTGSLLFVYLVGVAIAFVLVGMIVRNVNRLTRASQAIARGDFSVRVRSRSKDQIGDLARSFDAMAESIERLLRETKKKERLEAEIAIARTIQQKLLPPLEASFPGLSVLAHFEPVAEIGGDYYDYLVMPDGRTAIVLGDVSGHGLPTGLLVAMAKAGLSTLLQSGFEGAGLFSRLNDLIHRSTDARNYMTLALLAYDADRREGSLTNAGHLAPYRIGASGLESISLPSFPLGLSSGREFPTRTVRFEPGDRLVLLTDGLIEAADVAGEPFGFERIEALLRTASGAPAAEIRDTLLREVRTHSAGVEPEDDRTLVLVHFA